MTASSAIHIPALDDGQLTAAERPIQHVNILLGQLTLSRGIAATYAGMYQRTHEQLESARREIAELRAQVRDHRLAAANTALELTSALEHALQAALGAPSISDARKLYDAVDREMRDARGTLDDLERAENARLLIRTDDGTSVRVEQIGGAL